MLTVCCVYAPSTVYKDDYVIKLQLMVNRHLSVPHRFVCVTDESVPFVECIAPPVTLPRWWGKLVLFHPDLDVGDDVLYLDLDTIVLKNIDALAHIEGTFAAYRSRNIRPEQRKRLSSAIMRWRGDFSHIWTFFSNNRTKINMNLDEQSVIQAAIEDRWVDIVDVMPEDYIVEWMYDEIRFIQTPATFEKIYPNCAIICFGGSPKPHELSNGNKIVMEYWK